MAETQFSFGQRVQITRGDWAGRAAIVSWPVTEDTPGYALVCSEEKIAGIPVHIDDLTTATSETGSFTQLTYHLNRLASLLIEKTFL